MTREIDFCFVSMRCVSISFPPGSDVEHTKDTIKGNDKRPNDFLILYFHRFFVNSLSIECFNNLSELEFEKLSIYLRGTDEVSTAVTSSLYLKRAIKAVTKQPIRNNYHKSLVTSEKILIFSVKSSSRYAPTGVALT